MVNRKDAERRRYADLAENIIFVVEGAIRRANPEVERMASRRGRSLLYGDDYYALEDGLIELLERAMSGGNNPGAGDG